MNIQWISTKTTSPVYLSSDIAARHAINEKVEICFGQWKREVSVEIDETLPYNTIAISSSVMQSNNIPTNLPYEVVIEQNKIKIGPVIGIMVSFSRFFNHIESMGRTKDYKKIKGLLFIFRPKDVNLEDKTISGYYYNPNGKKKVTRWIEGTFPFPDVLYNRWKRIPKKLNTYLINHKIPFFNSHYLNKWEQYEVFSENPNLKSHLPETRKLTKSSLLKMLDKYDEIYVKPTSRANGEGIRLIEKKENGYVLVKNNSKRIFFNTTSSLYKAIKQKNYILQPSVAYKKGNRNLDFRVLLQKDETKKWNYTGSICRVSIKNSIITNFKNKDSALDGLEALGSIYQLSPEQAKEKVEEIVHLCKGLVKAIEDKGVHLGDVAFDIIIDSKLRLWVLEIQIRYGVFARRDVSPEFFHKFMVTPLYYAKALAGF